MVQDGAGENARERDYVENSCHNRTIEIQPELLLQKDFSRILNKLIVKSESKVRILADSKIKRLHKYPLALTAYPLAPNNNFCDRL